MALLAGISGALVLILGFFYYRSAIGNVYHKLFNLEEAFDTELDFIHLAKNILLKVMKETAAAAGIIYWFDETQREFKLRTLNGIAADRINQITRELRQPQGILRQIQDNPERLILQQIKKGGLLSEFATDYQSLLAIPLNIQKKPLGVIVLFRKSGTFSPNLMKLFVRFAPRAAMRLDNARLYQLAKETAMENARLYINISKLYQQATLDELTGLYNRNFLMQRLKEELKKAWRFKQPLAVIFADLDLFKNVNDEYGHQIGDQLLTEFGEFVKKSVREYDVACRFGGEEFVILLPNTKLNNAAELAERLRLKVGKHSFGTVAKGLKISVSFGVSSITDFEKQKNQLDDENLNTWLEDLLATADDALYQAKKGGRNQVVVTPLELNATTVAAKKGAPALTTN